MDLPVEVNNELEIADCNEIASATNVDIAVVRKYFYEEAGKSKEATLLEMSRRSSGKCLIVMQIAQSQQEFFRSCMENDELFPLGSLSKNEQFDDVAVCFPNYHVVQKHIVDKSVDDFFLSYVLGGGFREVIGVMTGSDGSTPMCDSLNEALGVPNFITNDTSLSEARRDKVKMQHALRDNGTNLRYIKSFSCKGGEEALNVIEMNDLKFPLIAKPSTGAGSEFIQMCHTREDVLTAFEVTCGLTTTQHTSTEEMCVQEYIDGEEFVVNVVSHNGIHVVTDCWKSYKYPLPVVSDRLRSSVQEELKRADKNRPSLPTTTIVYDRQEFIADISCGKIREVVDYTLRCLDALHVANGCSHSELRYDASGPCLIEANPRMAGDIPRGTKLVGYDQVSLICYLCRVGRGRLTAPSGVGLWPPKNVQLRYTPPNDALQTSHIVFLFVAADGVICDWGRRFLMQLPSFSRFTRSILREAEPGMICVAKKTTDLFGCPGAAVLEGTYEEVCRDTMVIRSMENGRTQSILHMFEQARDARRRLRTMDSRFNDLFSGENVDIDWDARAIALQEADACKRYAAAAVDSALAAFSTLTPPPLFIAQADWETIRDSSCGKCCGSGWQPA